MANETGWCVEVWVGGDQGEWSVTAYECLEEAMKAFLKVPASVKNRLTFGGEVGMCGGAEESEVCGLPADVANQMLDAHDRLFATMERVYLVSSFQALKSGHLFMLELRVAVAQPIEWVRAHAEEIARRGIQQDRVANKLASPIVALNVVEA